jgi:hypothetical protein
MIQLAIQLVIQEEVNKFIIKIFTYLIKLLKRVVEKIRTESPISILSISHHEKGRFLVYILNNNLLQAHKEVLRSIYLTLMTNKRFLSFGKKKVIIITALTNDGGEFSYHHNVLLTNDTSFEEYYDSVKEIINTNYEHGYQMDVVPRFKIRV